MLYRFFLISTGVILYSLNASAFCIQIEKININSQVSLPKTTQNKILKPFLSKCVTVDDLNVITHKLTNAYIKKGYITAQVIIPEQKPEEGVLTLEVNTGKIEEIEYEDPENSALQNEFPKIIGKSVNLRDIEQVIENLNQLRSNNAKIELKPGKEKNSSKVIVSNIKTKNFFISTGIDNSGDAEKGKYMGFSSLTFENLLSKNDALYLSERHNLSSRDKSILQNYNLAWTMPFDNYKLTFSYDYGTHKDEVDANKEVLIYQGKHHRGGINLTRNLIRHENKKLNMNFGFRKSNYIEKIDDYNLAIQSHKLSVFETGLNLTHKFSKAWMLLGCSIEKGLKSDSSIGEENNDLQPVSDFTKFICNANLSYNLYNFIDFGSLYLSSSLKFQHTPNILYSSEKFDVAGADSVRGFNGSNLKGERGYYIHNDLIYDSKILPSLEKLIGKIQFFTGVDFGEFYRNDNSIKKKGYVSSASVGVRSAGGIISSNLTFSKAKSCSQGLKPIKTGSVFFSVSVEV